MTEKDPKEPAFKVVDRRGFTEDGAERENRENEPKPKVKAEDRSKNADADEGFVRPPISFGLFVQSLAHQAMMGLGIVPWPDSGLVRLELTLAKETIDILQILKTKTANNLSKEEQALLDTLLYQLQIAFVEISNRAPDNSGSIIK